MLAGIIGLTLVPGVNPGGYQLKKGRNKIEDYLVSFAGKRVVVDGCLNQGIYVFDLPACTCLNESSSGFPGIMTEKIIDRKP